MIINNQHHGKDSHTYTHVILPHHHHHIHTRRMHLLHSAIMVNIVIKEEMLGFGYTENIVINIHFIKVILVREETHLQKSIFLHSQKRLQMECQLLTWSTAVVQVQELKACAKATPLLEDLEAGAVVQVLVLVLLYKWKRK